MYFASWKQPMSWCLALGIAFLAIVIPLVPEPYRMFNFAAFGAIGMFVAARVGWLPALVITLGTKVLADLLNYQVNHAGQAEYLPSWKVVACFAVYPLAGLLSQRTEQPWRLGGSVLLGSTLFFLLTNTLSWIGQALPYPMTFAGLMECYEMGLPFHRGTFLGDLGFTGFLFATHAALSRAYFPAERVTTAVRTA